MYKAVTTIDTLAQQWNAHVVWMRVNVGFIKAEERSMRREGSDTAQVRELLAEFEIRFREFSACEMDAFILARELDVMHRDSPELERMKTQELLRTLDKLKWVFKPWFEALHHAIQRGRNKADDRDRSLLMCCGTEMLRAHTAYREVIDDFMGLVSPPVPDTSPCPCSGPVQPDGSHGPPDHLERVRFIFEQSRDSFGICRCVHCDKPFLEEYNEGLWDGPAWTQWIPLTAEELEWLDKRYPSQEKTRQNLNPVHEFCDSKRRRLIRDPEDCCYWSDIKPPGFHR